MQFWAAPLWLGININVPETTQTTKLRMLSVNILLTIWSPANQILKKTWQLINELSSRHSNKVRNIAEIKVGEQTITESSEIAEELNLHFSSVGEKLASEIPSSNVEPESYLEATKTTFSLKDPPVSVVRKLNISSIR